MRRFFSQHTAILLVTLFIILSLFLHFYNLNWGAPFYFHPDERNIASSVSQLVFPTHMNPNFFAYGAFPIYIIFFSGLSINFFTHCHLVFSSCTVPFEQAILISRLFSALLVTILVPFLYVIGKKIGTMHTGLIASFLTSCSVGLIQFSHFGTFEMWLTFFATLLFYLCLKIGETKRVGYILLSGVVTGILVSTKATSLVFLPIILLVILLYSYSKNQKMRTVILSLRGILLVIATATLVFIITNPFVFLDYSDFLGSMKYETSVATGQESVFYSGEFYHTLPVVFQLLHVYPFLLNPVLTILFCLSFLYLCYYIFLTRNVKIILLFIFFLVTFLSQAVVFVKWVRYMVWTLPFVYLLLLSQQPNYISIFGFLENKKSFCFFRFLFISFALSSLSRILSVPT